jgi:gamma-glutamylcyclotransferase (GGCT)/AIG2-like uncharacterized protein YtfP
MSESHGSADKGVGDQPRFLFVYGSLRRGEPTFAELGLGRSLEYIGDAAIAGDLYDIGDYPGAIPGAGLVRGEIYLIKDPAILHAVDDYEEFDPEDPDRSLFVRHRVCVPEVGEAWTYFYNGSHAKLRRIRSGEWRKRRPAA